MHFRYRFISLLCIVIDIKYFKAARKIRLSKFTLSLILKFKIITIPDFPLRSRFLRPNEKSLFQLSQYCFPAESEKLHKKTKIQHSIRTRKFSPRIIYIVVTGPKNRGIQQKVREFYNCLGRISDGMEREKKYKVVLMIKQSMGFFTSAVSPILLVVSHTSIVFHPSIPL